MTAFANYRDVVLVAVKGPRLDAASAPAFKSQSQVAFEAKPRRAVLDMTQVDFIDSTGLSAVISLLKMMASDGAMAIAGAQPAVKRLLQITRLDQVLPVYPTAEEACAALVTGGGSAD